MDTHSLLKRATEVHKSTSALVKLMTDIIGLDEDKQGNLPALRDRIGRARETAACLSESAGLPQDLSDWLDKLERDLEEAEEHTRKRFGLELQAEIEKVGLSLSGQFPVFKAGLLQVEVETTRGRATLWYGPQAVKLGQCRLSAGQIAQELQRARQQLGSGLGPEEFLRLLKEAFRRVSGDAREAVPLGTVLPQMALLLQSPKFQQDPRRENFKDYGRADFSYDLFRLGKPSARLRLVVATLGKTTRRQDSLWVPNNEHGNGTMYSDIAIKEAER